jgi:glyoxylate/hydroxypyruvate reductase A
MSLLYLSDPVRGRTWARIFSERAPDIELHIWPQTGDRSAVEYLVAWDPPPGLIATLPNLKVVFSSGAGVDHLKLSSIPAHLPVVRMIEPGIVDGMIEYVTLAVLALHRNLFDFMRSQAAGTWQPIPVAPASARRIGVMGLGVLGQAVLQRLGSFGYRLYGWNRSRKQVAGVTCFAGTAALPSFLGHCDILVCLLPLTAGTRGILNREVFAALPQGASLINVGRGACLDELALLQALDSGRLSTAILDVFEPEPLPAAHPFWRHPRVVVTPHIGADTQPETAAPIVLDNIRRHQRGEAMPGTVDRERGY